MLSRISRSLFLVLPLLAPLAPVAGAQGDAGKTPFVIEPIQLGSKEDGQEVISVLEIKRALCYLVGTTDLEARKLDVFINEEMRAQIEAGKQAADYKVDAGEVEEQIHEAEAQIKEQYPTTPVETVLRSNQILSTQMWKDQLTQTKLFDLVFLPDDPDKWPAATVEAMKNMNQGQPQAEGGGNEFYEKIVESFRKANEQKNAEPAEGTTPAQQTQGTNLLRAILRQTVIGALTRNAEVKLASDGIPDDVAMVVNGVNIMTEDLYKSLAPRLTATDYEQTKRWLVKSKVIERELRARGDWLDNEQFAKVYGAHEEPFAGSPISLQVLAISFKRFPSLEIYKNYFRLLKSYEHSIEDEITEEALTAHLGRASMLMGLSQIDLEAILLSAFDFNTHQWKADGWKQAEARAREVTAKLADGGDWSELLNQYSEFWDPPSPKTPQPQQQQQPGRQLNKGRIGLINRNELVQKLGESEYSMFLDGSSVSDYAFFDQEPGTIDGPFKGRYGYYITRVNARTPPTHAMSLDNESQHDLVKTDYVQMRFNRWAEALMSDVKP